MRLINEFFSAEIGTDETYSLNSTDNKYYDVILNPSNYKNRDWLKAFSINIQGKAVTKNLVLIGSVFCHDIDCAVADNANLIVLMNTDLTVISTEIFAVLQHRKISESGTFFAIYPFDDGYIVYGELEIIKLNKDLKTQWSFSGGDIFVTNDGRTPFAIVNDKIQLLDWDGNSYTIDRHGKCI